MQEIIRLGFSGRFILRVCGLKRGTFKLDILEFYKVFQH